MEIQSDQITKHVLFRSHYIEKKEEYKTVRKLSPEGQVTVSLEKPLLPNERVLPIAPYLTISYTTTFNESVLSAAIDSGVKKCLVPDLISLKCAACNSDANKTCGDCKSTFYCSDVCQRQHWELGRHETDCYQAAQTAATDRSKTPTGSFVNKQRQNSDNASVNSGGKSSFKGKRSPRPVNSVKQTNGDVIDGNANVETNFQKRTGDDSNKENFNRRPITDNFDSSRKSFDRKSFDRNPRKSFGQNAPNDSFDDRNKSFDRNVPQKSYDRNNAQKRLDDINKSFDRNASNNSFDDRNTTFDSNASHKSFGRNAPSNRFDDRNKSFDKSRVSNGVDENVINDSFGKINLNDRSSVVEAVKEAPILPKSFVPSSVKPGDIMSVQVESIAACGGALCITADAQNAPSYGEICEIDASKEPPARMELGSLVAYMSEDGWYRGRVVAADRLWLVDAARLTSASESSVRRLPQKYADLPEFSAVLHVKGLEINGTYNCTVKEHLADGRIKVSVEDLNTEGYISRWSSEPKTKQNATVKSAPVNVPPPASYSVPPPAPVSSPSPAQVSASAAIPCVQRPSVQKGDVLCIVHADKEFVYVRNTKSDDEYLSTVKDIVVYGLEAKSLTTPPEVGTVIIAKYSDAPCRALVTRRHLGKDKYLLEYHDFGNTDTCNLAMLLSCPRNLAEKPVHVSKVKLSGVANQMSQEAVEYLIGELFEKQLIVRAVENDAVTLCVVDTGECVNVKVEKASRPTWMEYLNTNLAVIPPKMFSDLQELEIPLNGGTLVVLDSSLLGKRVLSCVSETHDDVIDKVSNELKADLEAYVKSEIGKSPYTPRHEELCIAKSPTFGEWFRGVCVDNDSTGIQILFVDYGNIETVTHRDIRRALPPFAELPVLCSICTIMDFPEEPRPEQLTKARQALGLEPNPDGNAIGKLAYKKAVSTQRGFYDISAPEFIRAVL